jgi:hypothetical protein
MCACIYFTLMIREVGQGDYLHFLLCKKIEELVLHNLIEFEDICIYVYQILERNQI